MSWQLFIFVDSQVISSFDDMKKEIEKIFLAKYFEKNGPISKTFCDDPSKDLYVHYQWQDNWYVDFILSFDASIFAERVEKLVDANMHEIIRQTKCMIVVNFAQDNENMDHINDTIEISCLLENIKGCIVIYDPQQNELRN